MMALGVLTPGLLENMRDMHLRYKRTGQLQMAVMKNLKNKKLMTMKFRCLFAAVCLMAVAVGCDKENPALSDADSGISQDIPEGYVAMRLSTMTLKTTFTGSNVNWDVDDKLAVFASGSVSGNYEFEVEEAVGSDASFIGYVAAQDASAERWIATYPYSKDITISGTTLSGVEVKSVQNLKAGSFGQGDNPSVGVGGKESLTFRNLCALIKIPVTGPVKVKTIIITAPEGRVLAGKGFVDAAATSPVFNVTENASNVVTLTADSAVDVTSGVNFYAAVVPQSVSAVYTVEVILEDGTSMIKTLESATLNRAQYKTADEMIARNAAVYYGSANCYIGKTGQDIEIDVTPYYTEDWSVESTYMPKAIPAFAGKVDAAQVVWAETGLTLSAAYADGKVTVSGITGNGNALVAIKNAEGVILWSYHIWVPVADPTNTLTYPMESAYTDVASYEVMPMALGAINTTGADAAGLFYQWGRKDPLGRTDLTKESAAYVECGVDWEAGLLKRDDIAQDVYLYSVQNPTKMILTGDGQTWLGKSNMSLWGNTAASGKFSVSYKKSVFDPCPKGYKTSPKELYTRFIKEGGTKALSGTGKNTNSKYYNVSNLGTAGTDLGFKFYYNGTDTDFYPFVGYRNSVGDGKITTNGTGGSLWSSAKANSGNQDMNAMRTAYTTSQIILFSGAITAAGYTVRCIKE